MQRLIMVMRGETVSRTRIPMSSVSFSLSLTQRHRPLSPSLCPNLVHQLDPLYHRYDVRVRVRGNDNARTAGDRPHGGD